MAQFWTVQVAFPALRRLVRGAFLRLPWERLLFDPDWEEMPGNRKWTEVVGAKPRLRAVQVFKQAASTPDWLLRARFKRNPTITNQPLYSEINQVIMSPSIKRTPSNYEQM